MMLLVNLREPEEYYQYSMSRSSKVSALKGLEESIRNGVILEIYLHRLKYQVI